MVAAGSQPPQSSAAVDNRASKERQNCSRVSRSKTKHRRASSGQCEVRQPWRAAGMVVRTRLCHLGMNAFTSVFGGAAACAIFSVGIPRDDRLWTERVPGDAR